MRLVKVHEMFYTTDRCEAAETDAMNGEHPVLAAERRALARWCRGDPSGFLELCDGDVGYFEPFRAGRIDGLAALTAHYEALRGRVAVRSWEIVEPRVVEHGDVAILSYRFRSVAEAGDEMHWQASEVYRLDGDGPRLLHTHWSLLGADAA